MINPEQIYTTSDAYPSRSNTSLSTQEISRKIQIWLKKMKSHAKRLTGVPPRPTFEKACYTLDLAIQTMHY